MNITDKLYVCIKKQSAARSEKWLARQMKVKARDILPALDELEESGRIYRTETGDYRAINEKYTSDGRVVLTAGGRAYVWLPDGRELPLDMPRRLAFPGEEVRVFLSKIEPPTALLIRTPDEFPGGADTMELEAAVSDVDFPPLYSEGDERDVRYLLSPLGSMRRLFRCELSGLESELNKGDVVRVRINSRPVRGDIMRCSLVRVERDPHALDMFRTSLEERYGLDTEQPEPDENQLKMLHSLHEQGAAEENRRDLRELVCFTIDGETAKDFDDAVSLRHEGGRTLLGVHIADVSHFVRTGSAIDGEAFRRGTSVYLPWRTIHMLPEALSCDLCSLMPDADRLAMTCEMELEDGHVRDYEIFPSIIHSHARLTYSSVNKLLEGGEDGSIPDELKPVLRDMRRLADGLAKCRHARGAINFESSEIEFRLDESGLPVELIPRKQGPAEALIEEFMLLANQTVAAHMLKNELGCVYRVHEKPAPEDMARLEELASGLGINWRAGSLTEPCTIQRLIEMSEDSPAKALIQTSALRSMAKARYSEKPLGHFGLALEDYCHFTSPIRRYPDLLVHRLLHFSFSGRASGGQRKLVQELPARAAACSACELNAAAAEREADNLLKCALMLGREGEEFEGAINGMCSWAVFVQLDNFCEGAVPLRTLDEYYTADEAMTRMVSDSGNVLEIGIRVRVKVSDVSLTEPRVYFTLSDID